MVKLTTIALLKWEGPSTPPKLVGTASDLSSFSFFQRGTVREMLQFVARTVAQKTAVGQRQSVKQDEYLCHSYNRDGLVAVVFADATYPPRAGFCVAAKVLEDYTAQHGDEWRGLRQDGTDGNQLLEEALVKYQDPAAADKLAKIQRDLDETKVILHQTIESVLDRGEKLDQLVDKSADLSLSSQMFYKQAKKANSCCSFM